MYIQVDMRFIDDVGVHAAAERMGQPSVLIIGMMVKLWCYALRYDFLDGDVTEWTPAMFRHITGAASGTDMYEAFIYAGLITEGKDGKRFLANAKTALAHGAYRLKERERKRNYREKQRQLLKS